MAKLVAAPPSDVRQDTAMSMRTDGHQHLCERHTGQAGSHADGKVRYINGGRPAGGLGAADGQRGRLSKIRDDHDTRRHAGNASSEVANAAKASARREVVPAKTSHGG